jgi:HEAT repeat protein
MVEPLIEGLKDGDDSVRRVVVKALGNLRDERAVEPLIQVLENEIAQEDAAITRTKEEINVIEFYAQILEKRWIQRDLLAVLGKIRNEKAIEPLIEALEEKVRFVQNIIVSFLRKMVRSTYGSGAYFVAWFPPIEVVENVLK